MYNPHPLDWEKRLIHSEIKYLYNALISALYSYIVLMFKHMKTINYNKYIYRESLGLFFIIDILELSIILKK